MPEDFITEADAYAAYGHVLEDKELRNARHAGRLGFMRRKRTIFYRRDELESFVSSLLAKDYVEPCQKTIAKMQVNLPSDHLFSGDQAIADPDQLRHVLKLFERPRQTKKR
ncbi:hypothetical protein LPLAFNJD_LOCUS1938 [Methylorubrum aminovorans]